MSEENSHIELNYITIIKRLESQVEFLTDRYAENFYQTIQALAVIASVLDKYYEGSHSRYVSQKSAEVATILEMNETDIFEIRMAGLLHDLGKIGFKESMLSKAVTEMTENEFELYTKHTSLALEILNKHKGFSTISKIIYQHHERLDGSGFPQRLKGKQIHPGAAVISVVDTFHNIMYKLGKDKTVKVGTDFQYTSTSAYLDSSKNRYATAMNFLDQKAGTYFSKNVVETFTLMAENERKKIGQKTVLRLPINQILPGMVFADDYFTSYGLLVAARGEIVTEDILHSLVHFINTGEIPIKILVMK